MIKLLALNTIKIYQKFISPYKGFSCAYKVATNEISCSVYGKKVIKRFGLLTGAKLLNRRFHDCSWCNEQLKNKRKIKENTQSTLYRFSYLHSKQGGFIDSDCGECDTIDFSTCDCSTSLPESCNTSDNVSNMCFWMNITNDCGSSHSNENFKTKRDYKNSLKHSHLVQPQCNPENCNKDVSEQCENCPKKSQ